MGQSIDTLGVCHSISNAVSLHVNNIIEAIGELVVDSIEVVCDEFISKIFYFDNGIEGEHSNKWLLTDTSGTIISIIDTDTIAIPNDEFYQVYLISYDRLPKNMKEGLDIGEVSGCFSLSAPYVVSPIINDAGTIGFEDGREVFQFCGVGIQDTSIEVSIVSQGYTNDLWILTDEDGKIIDTFLLPIITFDNLTNDTCYIRHITGYQKIDFVHVDSVFVPPGCVDISNTLTIVKTRISSGSLRVNDAEEIQVCTGDLEVDELDIVLTGANGGSGAWILTDTSGLLLSILATPPNNLNGIANGTCVLYHIRYFVSGIKNLIAGANIEDIEGCFELSNPIVIHKTTVDGGRLTVRDSLIELSVCVDDGELEQIVPQHTMVNQYTNQWIVTDPIGQIISVDSMPPFNFEGQESGQCFIWNINYDGMVEGLEINGFISNLSGCYNLSNPIRIRKRTGLECTVSAGNINIDETISIYPNPSKGVIYLSNEKHLGGTISVTNLIGAKVLSTALSFDKLNTIDVSYLPEGLYFVKVRLQSSEVVLPLFIEK